jgi:hypothetical protein
MVRPIRRVSRSEAKMEREKKLRDRMEQIATEIYQQKDLTLNNPGRRWE